MIFFSQFALYAFQSFNFPDRISLDTFDGGGGNFYWYILYDFVLIHVCNDIGVFQSYWMIKGKTMMEESCAGWCQKRNIEKWKQINDKRKMVDDTVLVCFKEKKGLPFNF